MAPDHRDYRLDLEPGLKKSTPAWNEQRTYAFGDLSGRALTQRGARNFASVSLVGYLMFRSRNILCFILMLILAGCSAATGIQPAQYAEASANYARPAPLRGSDGPYVLGPGDRLRIKIYSDPDMTGEYEINSGGSVSLPLVGDVKAIGKTTRQFEQAIAARMKGKVATEPHVSVEIASYAPFYVMGEVKKAGEYQYHIGLTVADAIATAGGLTYRANDHKIILRRAGSTAERIVSLEVPVKVYPGDNIRVTESFF